MIGGVRKTELSDKLIQEIDEKANGNDLLNLQEEVKSQRSDLTSVALGKGASLIGVNDANNRFTATTVEGVLNELFQFASDGKSGIATVVGSPLLAKDTFQQQRDKIQTINDTLAKLSGTSYTQLSQIVNYITSIRDDIASSINSKGISASNSDNFTMLKNKIDSMSVIKHAKGLLPSVVLNGGGTGLYTYVTISGLSFKPKTIIFFRPFDSPIDSSTPFGTIPFAIYFYDEVTDNGYYNGFYRQETTASGDGFKYTRLYSSSETGFYGKLCFRNYNPYTVNISWIAFSQ